MFVVCGEALCDVFAAGDTPTGMAMDGFLGLQMSTFAGMAISNALALSINNEDAVIGRNAAFTQAGGEFRSIFRASSRSIFHD